MPSKKRRPRKGKGEASIGKDSVGDRKTKFGIKMKTEVSDGGSDGESDDTVIFDAKELAALEHRDITNKEAGKILLQWDSETKDQELQKAAMAGNLPKVKLLLDYGANPRTAFPDGPYSGITSLHLAAANGHIAVVEALIAFDAVMSGGATRLHVATQNNYIDAARFDGLTPLHIAAQNGYLGVVLKLIQYGATLNVVTVDNETPLYLATQGCLEAPLDDSLKCHVAVVLELLLSGADSSIAITENGLTPLHMAAHNGCLGAVLSLIGHGATLDAVTADGKTPLYLASENGHSEVVKALLTALSANLLACRVSHSMFTTSLDSGPLHVAAEQGHLEVIRLLLSSGANSSTIFTVGSCTGTTALYMAAQNNHVAVARMLLEYKADIGATITDTLCVGATSLYVTAQNGHVDMVKLLLDWGADLDGAKIAGAVTPLFGAVANGHVIVVRLLLERGANPNITNAQGQTLLELANERGHTDVVKLLMNYSESTESSLETQDRDGTLTNSSLYVQEQEKTVADENAGPSDGPQGTSSHTVFQLPLQSRGANPGGQSDDATGSPYKGGEPLIMNVPQWRKFVLFMMGLYDAQGYPTEKWIKWMKEQLKQLNSDIVSRGALEGKQAEVWNDQEDMNLEYESARPKTWSYNIIDPYPIPQFADAVQTEKTLGSILYAIKGEVSLKTAWCSGFFVFSHMLDYSSSGNAPSILWKVTSIAVLAIAELVKVWPPRVLAEYIPEDIEALGFYPKEIHLQGATLSIIGEGIIDKLNS